MLVFDEGGIQVFEWLLLDWCQVGVIVFWIEYDLEVVGCFVDWVSGFNCYLLFDGLVVSSLILECLFMLFFIQFWKNVEVS